ncbi:hypothetical protein BGZ97_003614, partial [Linnemannia gamsii]
SPTKSIKTNNTLESHAGHTKHTNVGAPDQVNGHCTAITTIRVVFRDPPHTNRPITTTSDKLERDNRVPSNIVDEIKRPFNDKNMTPGVYVSRLATA